MVLESEVPSASVAFAVIRLEVETFCHYKRISGLTEFPFVAIRRRAGARLTFACPYRN